MSGVHIHQIFYDEASRQALDPQFLPLDNSRAERPDWFEFWPIRQYLQTATLNEGDWYGFLSPKFRAKTGVDAAQLRDFLEFSSGRSEVALITVSWDQLAYFQNPFEQGELWHPGLGAVCQSAAAALGFDLDLRATVAHSGNFTFCNYLIAKPVYWRHWLALANRLLAFAEQGPQEQRGRLAAHTTHTHAPIHTPMKAFVQERLPLLLILQQKFRTTTLDASATGAIEERLFGASPQTRGLLQACDQLKRAYAAGREPRYLEAYRALRGLIPTRLPQPQPVREAV
jgi:hypothetical protein